MHEPTPDDLWESQEGDVPVVNPADLKNVWAMFRVFQARNPGHGAIFGNSLYERVCTPGADVMSVWYRVSMVAMMMQMMPQLLAPWTHDGQPDDVVFQVAATFPMEKMRTGVVRNALPFDVQEFVKQIGART